MIQSGRLSMGGDVVRRSLMSAGVSNLPPNVSLIETTRSAADCILVQSAWNVIPRAQFDELIHMYPLQYRARAEARRLLAMRNIRRAKKVVCLSYYMAQLCAETLGVDAVVSPITLPCDDFSSDPFLDDWREEAYALVVGTLTEYKRPELAVDLVANFLPHCRRILFAGSVDRPELWAAVLGRAGAKHIRVRQDTVIRGAMSDIYKNASAVILPSALESLSFALPEALSVSRVVVASPIPVHMEVAARYGRLPLWLSSQHEVYGEMGELTRRPDPNIVQREWLDLAEELSL
jgi:glycosyltransferase involved in cell wall biosynthesis